jgi:N-glycosidase YbiA
MTIECHGLDTPERVCFYEQDFYVLSNFSAFCLHWRRQAHFTSEHAYHWARFDLPDGKGLLLQDCVQRAGSAHDAFKFAQENKSKQRDDWDAIKVDTMREILRAKAEQHEYVRRKLLATGDRELVENSWRDDFWGWGPNRDGQNMLGKLWTEIRSSLREGGSVER